MQQNSRPPYFVHPLVDSFFLGVGSLFCFLYYRYAVPGYSILQVNEGAIFLATTLGWVGSWPHFSATAWRLYESRANRTAFALTAWLVPALVAAATLACFVFPVSFAPFFLKVFILWSPWHFSLQGFGLLLLYARRADFPVPKAARSALLVFFLSSFFVQYTEAEASFSMGFLYAISYPQLALPAYTTLICKLVMYASLALAAFLLYPACRQRRPGWILLVPLLTQYLWFVHGAKDISFQLLLPLFHGLQYLLVAWAVEVQLRPERGPLKATLRWAAVNFLVGGALFWGIPQVLALAGVDLAFSTLVLLAAISLHHYFVDGVIWKLQKEQPGSPLFGTAWRRP